MSLIITIGRQFGSGGRDVGEKVAEYFNIPFYAISAKRRLKRLTNMQQTVFFTRLQAATTQ